MAENNQEFEQGFSDRRSTDRQKIVDDSVADVKGTMDNDRAFQIELRKGPKGPFREVAPGPGVTRAFSDRPLPEKKSDIPGLEAQTPAAEKAEVAQSPRDFGPVSENGQRVFDQFFENFRADLLQRVDPHQGITAENYDFEALWLEPQLKELIKVEPFFGKLQLPEEFRTGKPAKLPPNELLESVKRQRNERLEKGEIGALTPQERGQLFDHLDNFLNQPKPEFVTQADLKKFKAEQDKRKRQRPQIKRDPRDVPGITEQIFDTGIKKMAARFPKAIRAGGDAIRKIEIPGANTPTGKPFTAGELFEVFGINEVIEIPKVKEPKVDDATVDTASEFLAIALAFLILKGGGAPGLNAPLVIAEIGTLDTQQNLANLVQGLDPEAQSLILDTLAANPDDSDFAKLGKALVADVAMPTVLVNAILKALMAFKRAGGLRALEGEEGSIELGPTGASGINPEKDSLFVAIGKLGGLKKDEVTKLMGLDPKQKIPGPVGKPVLRIKGAGRPFDQMAEALGLEGYLTPNAAGKFDTRELEEKFAEELAGRKQFSVVKDFDLETEAGKARLKELEDFKENAKFNAEQDLKAKQAFERANAEQESLEEGLAENLRGIIDDNTISAGEKLNVIINSAKTRPVDPGKAPTREEFISRRGFDEGLRPEEVTTVEKTEFGREFDALADSPLAQPVAGGAPTGKRPVGKILKGPAEEIPDEVLKRVAGLRGRHIDIGGRLSINWSIVPERLKGTIKVVRETFEREIEEGVPVRKQGTAVAQARTRIEKGLDDEIFRFMSRDFQTIPPNDVDVVIGNWIADDAALQLYKTQEATINDVPGASFEFLKMLALNADVQKQRQLMSATTSRTFASNAIPPELTGVPFDTRNYSKLAAEFGAELPPGVDAKTIALRMQNTITSPEAAETFARQASTAIDKGRFSSAFMEYWINSLLSGPQTQAVNFASNAAFAAWQIPERMIAAGVSKLLRTQDGVKISESVAQLNGAVEGMGDGFRVLWYNLNRAVNPFKLGDVEVSISQKLETARHNAITANSLNTRVIPLAAEDGTPNTLGVFVDYGGEVVRAPGKLLMTFDEWFKGIGYRMELRAQAKRFASQQLDDGVEVFAGRVAQQEALDLGLQGKKATEFITKRQRQILENPSEAINNFYQSVVDNPPPWIQAKGISAATYQTFTNDLGPTGQAATKLLNSNNLLRLFVPFFRTPVNILSRNLERTPLGLATAFRKKGPERDIAIARVIMGTSSMVWAFNAANQGKITGNGPVNRAAKDWLRTSGWQPNSLVTFDKDGKKVYTSINRLDPFGSWLTMAADMQAMWGYLNDEERQDLASAAVLALRNNVLSKTWFRGLAEATTAMQLNDPGRFVANFAGSMVPNLGATFERDREGFLPDIQTKDPTAGIGTTSEATTNLKEVLGLPDDEIDQPKGTHPSLILFERVLRKMKTRVPWWDNEGAVPDYDIWGETRVLTGGWGPDLISPFWQSFEKGDKVAKEFIDNKVDVGEVGSTLRGVRLTPTERRRYAELAGNELKVDDLGNLGARDYLKQFIQSPEYLALTPGKDGGRSHMLRSILLSFRGDAGKMLIAETPRLQRALSIKITDKAKKLGRDVTQGEVLQQIEEQITNLEVR